MAANGEWFELYVEDMVRAKAFYQVVFAMVFEKLDCDKSDELMEVWLFPPDNPHFNAPGALVYMKGVKPGERGCMVYFACDDCDSAARRIETAGGSIVQPKRASPFGWSMTARDTEGNLIGLYS